MCIHKDMGVPEHSSAEKSIYKSRIDCIQFNLIMTEYGETINIPMCNGVRQ